MLSYIDESSNLPLRDWEFRLRATIRRNIKIKVIKHFYKKKEIK